MLVVGRVWLRWEKCALIQLCDPADHVHERSRHVKSLPPHVPGSDVHMTRRPAETSQGAQFKAFVITHELSGVENRDVHLRDVFHPYPLYYVLGRSAAAQPTCKAGACLWHTWKDSFKCKQTIDVLAAGGVLRE